MPHHGEYEHVKEWLQDHDSDVVDETPPVQNTWYENFDAEDVRLLFQQIYQKNDETAAKDLEIRWTIDGNVYFTAVAALDGTYYYVFREGAASSGGTDGLGTSTINYNAGIRTDKRGLDFKVEVRMTSVPGTNQRLLSNCVRETLEVT